MTNKHTTFFLVALIYMHLTDFERHTGAMYASLSIVP